MKTIQTASGRPPRHLPAAVRLVAGILFSLLVSGCFRAVAPVPDAAGTNNAAILRTQVEESLSSPQNPNDGYGWGSTDFHLVTDDLGSVVAATDRTGAVVERYAYDDFGSPTIYAPDGTTVRAASLIRNDVLFAGARWHADLGLYWMRYRWYDPATGRFLTQDPIGLWGDPFNLGNGMAYVGHSPGTWVDFFGLESCGNAIEDAGWGGSFADLVNGGFGGGTFARPAAGPTLGTATVQNAKLTGGIQATADAANEYANEIAKDAVLVGLALLPGPEDALLLAASAKVGSKTAPLAKAQADEFLKMAAGARASSKIVRARKINSELTGLEKVLPQLKGRHPKWEVNKKEVECRGGKDSAAGSVPSEEKI